MSKEKLEIRKIPLLYVEVERDQTACITRGEYRAQLDFNLPSNGKNKRLFRMPVSATEIVYLRERLDAAEKIIRQRFEDSFK